MHDEPASVRPLPPEAIERALRPLRFRHSIDRFLQTPHSVPIARHHWNDFRDALTAGVDSFVQAIEPPPDRTFAAVRQWALLAAEARSSIYTRLAAMSPFEPFRTEHAEALITVSEDLTTRTLATLVDGTGVLHAPRTKLEAVRTQWLQSRSELSEVDALRNAFNMPSAPIDDRGSFRADWVLEHYAYDARRLWDQIMPHLTSLSAGGVTDVLVALNIVGDTLASGQPVLAFISMNTFAKAFLEASATVSTHVQAHLLGRQVALRQTDIAIRDALTSDRARTRTESHAIALADAYRRVVEGPVRQYAWTLRALQAGTWEPVPNVGELRERLLSEGGFLGEIATDVLIPELRNSQAHETLEWDGLADEFRTETSSVSRDRVITSMVQASAFTSGCRSAFAAAISLQVDEDGDWHPRPNESGRMPNWQRALAYFGTNTLRVTDEDLNTKDATIEVVSVEAKQINPCFQALVAAHLLLPAVETFAVRMAGETTPLIMVSAESLAATLPVWTHAVDLLDRMPFSTFLPANFDARRRIESNEVAQKAVAWIAADDLLDAIDGSPDVWGEPDLRLIDARLSVVELGLAHTRLLSAGKATRIDSVLESVRTLRSWAREATPSHAHLADDHAALALLRHQWSTWGPVRRHPLVPLAGNPDYSEARPEITTRVHFKAYQSL